MMTDSTDAFVPTPPRFAVDWKTIEAHFEELAPLAACVQDATYHQEGDVLTHTKMVVEALIGDVDYQSLDEDARTALFYAALFHDIAKPESRVERATGRISHPYHGPRGGRRTQAILWKRAFPFALRQQIAALIRHHLLPYNWHRKDDADARVITISQHVPCRWLAILARADIRGRICDDQPSLLENIDLFDEFCKEKQCWEQSYEFSSDFSRFFYLQRPGRSPDYHAHDESSFEVIMLSGLPGAGKDTYCRKELGSLPMISLDQIRSELELKPGEQTGKVIAIARERAKEFLRDNHAFVWNATNLTRRIRVQLKDLFVGYGARIRLVYLETSWEELLRRNAARTAALPITAIEKMTKLWEMPQLDEAHRIDTVLT